MSCDRASNNTDSGAVNQENSLRRWFILCMNCLSLLLNSSGSYHVGVLNLAILDTYRSDVVMTSWLMAFYLSMFALAAPISSTIINLTNCRTCVVLSGLVSLIGFASCSLVNQVEWFFLTLFIAGLGQSMAMAGGCMILPFYFPKLIPIVMGICLVFTGLGSFVHPPLLQALIELYGLMGALLLIGAISLHSSAAGLLMAPNKIERQMKLKHASQTTKEKLMGQLEILYNTSFLLLQFSIFLQAASFVIPVVFLPEYLVQVSGFGKQDASFAAAMVGVGSLISRLLIGFAVMEPKIGDKLMQIGMTACMFLLCLLAPVLLTSRVGVYVFSLLVGVYAGGPYALIVPLTLSILGLQKAASGYGISQTSFGIGALVSPPVAAWVIEHFGYDALFYFSGMMSLASSAFAVFCALCHTQTSCDSDVMSGAQSGLKFDSFGSCTLYFSEPSIPVMENEHSTTLDTKEDNNVSGIQPENNVDSFLDEKSDLQGLSNLISKDN